MPLITVNPTSNVTPDPGQGGLAVTGNINTGHSSTTASVVGAGGQTKTCKWTVFPSVGGQILSVTLKVDWTQNGVTTDGFALTANQFLIEYSLNNGSSWNTLRNAALISSSSSGTATQSLSNAQDLTQVQVRDKLSVTGDVGQSVSVTASTSQIRLEVTTVDAQVIVMM